MRAGHFHPRATFLLTCALSLTACASTPRDRGPAPKGVIDFELPSTTGKRVNSRAYRGRVVLVDFWATWCKPCEASMPFYASLYKKLGSDGFSVLAISVDLHDEDVSRFLSRLPLPFTVLRDPEGKVATKFDSAVETMPTAVLLGRDGKIRLVHSGFVDGDQDKIERAVLAALKEPGAPKTTSTSTVP